MPRTKKTRKLKMFWRLAIAAAAVAMAGVLYFALANAVVIGTTAQYRLTAEGAAEADLQADCILVLGCRVYNDTPSVLLSDRLAMGLALYQAGVAPKLLLSGDNGQVEYNEPQAMYLYMKNHGVPEEDIFLDYAGFDTYSSARRARDVFGVRSVVVVTQEFHLARAVYDLRALGIEAHGVPARQGNYVISRYNDLREMAGRAKDFPVAGLIRPLPAFLGESIDIHGDGRVTHPIPHDAPPE